MSDNNVEVKFGGDASGVTSAADTAANDIKRVSSTASGLQGVFQRVSGSFDQFKTKMKGLETEKVTSGMEGGFKRVEGAMGSLTSATTGGVGSMVGSFGALGQAIGSVLAVLGPVGIAIGLVVTAMTLLTVGAYKAIEGLMEFGEKMAEGIEHMDNLSKKTGMTIEQMSGMSQVAQNVGVSTDSFSMGMVRLERSLASAAAGNKRMSETFKGLGIDAKTTKDPMDAVLKIADRFKDAPDGMNKTATAMTVMGRAGANMIPVFDQGSEALREQMKVAEEYGTIVDEDLKQKGLEAKEAFNEQREGVLGLKNAMFRELAPAITAITTYFNGLIKEMIHSYQTGGTVKTMLHALLDAFKVLGTIIMGTIGVLRALCDVLLAAANGFNAVNEAIAGNFSDAKADALAMVGHIKDIGTAAVNTYHSIKGLWSGAHFKAAPETASPSDDINLPSQAGKTPKAKKGNNEAAKKELAEKLEALDAEMDAEKENYAASMALEDQKLALIKAMYGADSVEYQRELRNKEKMQRAHQQELIKIEQERLKHVEQLETIDAERDNQVDEQKLEQARNHMAAMEAMGKVHLNDKLAADRAFADQEVDLEIRHEDDIFNIKDRALREQLKLIGLPEAEQRRINEELEVLERQHQATITGIRAKAATETAKLQDSAAQQMLQSWQTKLAPLEQATNGFFQSMLQGATTFKAGILQMLNSLASQYLQMGIQSVFHHIAFEHVKTAATVAGVGARTTAEAAGATQSVGISAMSALKQIAHHAAVAAAGAYAAIARIPYVGPFLAPAAAAVALYGVYKLGSSILSAEGGDGEVQKDGAMYQLHKKEMVLPAKFANPLRDMLAGAGPRFSGLGTEAASAGAAARDMAGQSGGDTHLHYSPNVTNGSSSLEDMLRNEGRTMRKWVKNEVRNGSLTLKARAQ